METLNKFLNWLNGKKTIIGLLATSILQIDGLFDSTEGWYKIALYIAGILAVGGLAHKGKKSLK